MENIVKSPDLLNKNNRCPACGGVLYNRRFYDRYGTSGQRICYGICCLQCGKIAFESAGTRHKRNRNGKKINVSQGQLK